MDDVIEVIIEELLEAVLEGIDGASTSKRVPAWLRILAAVLLFLVLSAVFGLMVFTGIMLIKEDGAVLPGIFMFAIAALTEGYLIRKFVKIFKNRRS